MNICIFHSRHCKKSAEELAKVLGCKSNNYSITGSTRHLNYDLILSYGCSVKTSHKARLNSSAAILTCVDKLKTFKLFTKHNIPTVEYTTDKKIASLWDVTVCRKSVDGKANDGMTYAYKGEPIPDAALYTKVFKHKCEYRVVVFQGCVVGRYRKDVNDKGDWDFTVMLKRGFEDIDAACIQAAQVLEIDYVGFDVLAAKSGKFAILEANSGPVLTDEVAKAIKKKLIPK